MKTPNSQRATTFIVSRTVREDHSWRRDLQSPSIAETHKTTRFLESCRLQLSNVQPQLDQARVKDGQAHAECAAGLSDVSTSKSALVAGAIVEVWSNTNSKWCPGKVLSVAENSVTLEYTRDVEGSSSKIVKALPIGHQDLRLAPVPDATVEVWSNTNSKWCPGKVLSVKEYIVTLEYTRNEGCLSSKVVKALPIGHQDLRAQGQAEEQQYRLEDCGSVLL